MNKQGRLLIVAFALCVSMSYAQESRPTLDTMLNDAAYVFNRYEELASGLNCESWQTTAEIKKQCKSLAVAVGRNVKNIKTTLSRASKAKTPKLVDLFDIYSELQEVATSLDGFGCSALAFPSLKR